MYYSVFWITRQPVGLSQHTLNHNARAHAVIAAAACCKVYILPTCGFLQGTIQVYIAPEVTLDTALGTLMVFGFVGVDTVAVGGVLGNDSPDLFGS
jgi:hypothetical protein